MPINRLPASTAESLWLKASTTGGFVKCPIPHAANPVIEQLYRVAWENALASAQFAWRRELTAVHNN